MSDIANKLEFYKRKEKLRKNGFDPTYYFSNAIFKIKHGEVIISSKRYYIETLPQQSKQEINAVIAKFNFEVARFVHSMGSDHYVRLSSYYDSLVADYLEPLEKKFGIKLYDKDVVEPYMTQKEDEFLKKLEDERVR